MNIDELIDKGDPREIKRAIAVKMSLAGHSRADISEILNITPEFVSKWKAIYLEKGANSLRLSYKGSYGYLSKEDRMEIIQYIKENNSIRMTELISCIKENYKVEYSSQKSYYDLLHEAGMSWKKTEKCNPKKDEQAVLLKRDEIKKNFWTA